MTEEDIPEDIKTFLADYIDSVVQLELLMLLRNRPEETWTVEAVASALRIDRGWTARELEHLAARGLILVVGDAPPTYRPGSQTTQLERSITRSIDAYEKRRVSIIGLIYSRPIDAFRTFAEAFRVRKD